jgi:ATP-dependent DNA ligase
MLGGWTCPSPPVTPMLAKPVPEVPDGPYLYEPKWDGLR